MQFIKRCEAVVAKHNHYISTFVLAIAAIVALDLVMPTMLLAAEPTSSQRVPMRAEFEKPRQENRLEQRAFEQKLPPVDPSSPAWAAQQASKMNSSSVFSRPTSTMTREQLMARKNEQVKRLKETITAMEKALKTMRSQLERLQKANPSSTPAVNLDQLRALMEQVKNAGQFLPPKGEPVKPMPPLVPPTVTTSPGAEAMPI